MKIRSNIVKQIVNHLDQKQTSKAVKLTHFALSTLPVVLEELEEIAADLICTQTKKGELLNARMLCALGLSRGFHSKGLVPLSFEGKRVFSRLYVGSFFTGDLTQIKTEPLCLDMFANVQGQKKKVLAEIGECKALPVVTRQMAIRIAKKIGAPVL